MPDAGTLVCAKNQPPGRLHSVQHLASGDGIHAYGRGCHFEEVLPASCR
jgi:hypothetical protein